MRNNEYVIGSDSFNYDDVNRLTSASVGGNTTTLSYDPVGRLRQLSATGETTVFMLYSGNDLVAEYTTSDDDDQTLTNRYIPGPGTDDPLVWYTSINASSRLHLHANAQGSIVAVSDGAGSATQTFKYDPYGNPSSSTGARFKYTGQLHLPKAGLYHYKARAYSSTLGRFLQTDPIGYGDGLNMYAYVHGDPVNSRDPSGLADCQEQPGASTLCKGYNVTIYGGTRGARVGGHVIDEFSDGSNLGNEGRTWVKLGSDLWGRVAQPQSLTFSFSNSFHGGGVLFHQAQTTGRHNIIRDQIANNARARGDEALTEVKIHTFALAENTVGPVSTHVDVLINSNGYLYAVEIKTGISSLRKDPLDNNQKQVYSQFNIPGHTISFDPRLKSIGLIAGNPFGFGESILVRDSSPSVPRIIESYP